MKDGYLRGAHPQRATQRQKDVFAAYVAASGSVSDAAEVVGIRPSTGVPQLNAPEGMRMAAAEHETDLQMGLQSRSE